MKSPGVKPGLSFLEAIDCMFKTCRGYAGGQVEIKSPPANCKSDFKARITHFISFS